MIKVRCNGKEVRGFSDVSITMSMDAIAASYTMNTFTTKESAWLPVFPSDEVEILIDDEVVIKGYNDRTMPSFSISGNSCSIAGREITCDLVDCVVERLNYENKKADEIVRSICAEYGIKFIGSGADVGKPFAKISFDASTTAFSAIRSICAERRLLVHSDGIGCVTIDDGKYGSAEVDLVQGVNVISAVGNFNVSQRFSEYAVYSASDAKGKTFAKVADEENNSRKRKFALIDEKFSTKENCESRAMWEAMNRQARSGSLNVVVSGWRQKQGGSLWKPGIIVSCDIPSVLGEGRCEYLVNRVVFSFGNSGTQTTLSLVDREIYVPAPSVMAANKTKAKKKQKDTWANVRKQTGSKLNQ